MKLHLQKISILLFVILSFKGYAQDSTLVKSPLHKKNIFTLGLYKQPGIDSMVDFVDGIYRVLNITKPRGMDQKLNMYHLAFVPGVEYSLATGFATSINADIILPYKNPKDNQSIIFSELKYTQNKQIISQLASNLWLNNISSN